MGLLELTALELGKQIKEKKVSVKEAVEASFSRIRAVSYTHLDVYKRQDKYRSLKKLKRFNLI